MKFKSEEEKRSFMTMFNKLGFDSDKTSFDISEEVIKDMQSRLNQFDLLVADKERLPKKSLDEVVSKTRKILLSLFQGVNLQVDVYDLEYDPYEGKLKNSKNIDALRKKYQSLMVLFQNGKITEEEFFTELLNEYKRNSKRCSAFQIPIITKKEFEPMIGMTSKGPLICPGDKEVLKRTPVYMEAIFLGAKEVNLLSIGTYAHELTHALIDRNKGVVENYYNDEVLSIFMEKVAIDSVDTSKDKKALKIAEIRRLRNLKDSIDKLSSAEGEDYYSSLKYIQSTIYAAELFEKYSKSSKEEKDRIIKSIRKIVSGEKTVSDLIKEEGLTLDTDSINSYFSNVEGYVKEFQNRTGQDY